jgi:hypothetical protein
MFLREYTCDNIIRNICLDHILKLGIIITKYQDRSHTSLQLVKSFLVFPSKIKSNVFFSKTKQ